MNAQEKISIALQSSVFNQNFADAVAKELYNLVAHELAEEIRDFAARERDMYSDDELGGMQSAADRIDPKVEK